MTAGFTKGTIPVSLGDLEVGKVPKKARVYRALGSASLIHSIRFGIDLPLPFHPTVLRPSCGSTYQVR